MLNARNGSVLVVGLLALLPRVTMAQEFLPQTTGAPQGYAQQAYPQPGDPNAMPPGAPPQQPVYTQQQLEQLVAPIALYPDPLIAQILMASTYPLEIVEAQRWHANPQNAALSGPQLQAALDQEPWDPSVKALAATPQVLLMMDNNLQWTEQLGDAFLASQPAIMDSVQSLRQKAQAAGNLTSTPQQVVVQQQGAIVIQPANPQVIYVPYYNPTVVYGPWPWAAYPPYYFPAPPGYVYYNSGLFGFGVGIAVADWLWGWDHWDWHRRAIIIDDHRYAELNRGRPPHFADNRWEHDPGHRHGVPYRSPEVRQQFQGGATQARQGYRGYFNAPQNHGAENIHPAVMQQRSFGSGQHGEEPLSQARSMQPRPTPPTAPHVEAPAAPQSRNVMPLSGAAITRSSPETRIATPAVQSRSAQQRSAPMFESFSHGSDVHAQAARGSSSRASAPPEAHASHAESQAHGGGGNPGGGHGGGEHGQDKSH